MRPGPTDVVLIESETDRPTMSGHFTGRLGARVRRETQQQTWHQHESSHANPAAKAKCHASEPPRRTSRSGVARAQPVLPVTLRLSVLGGVDLRDATGREVSTVLCQSKRLALLACLAMHGRDGFLRRDTLLGMFWPALDQEHARAALAAAGSELWFQNAVASPFHAGALERYRRAQLLLRLGDAETGQCWASTLAERSPWELVFRTAGAELLGAETGCAALSARSAAPLPSG